jgi:hypothetical protein
VTRRLLVSLGVVFCVDGHAQTMSDLPSTQTQPSPPPGTASPYYPGAPMPAAPAAPQGEGKSYAPDKGGKEKAPSGLILMDQDSLGEPGEVSVAPGGPASEIPETHTVQKGDTLWDLSAHYYRNAWGWPKLWSYNPQITNPHWIYPGDVIRLMLPGAPPPAEGPVAKGEGKNGPNRIIGRGRATNGIFLRQTGFVEPGELAQAGKIVGSKEEKIMLGTLDEAYVEYTKEKPFQVGERYTIYKPTDEVKHPVTGKTLGTMVEILGEGEVRAVTDGKIARVAIVDSLNPIERGFLIGPLKRQFKIVQPVTDKSDLQGVVVATLQPRDLLGADNLVFMDRGKSDGVEIGNRFIVTRRGDGYQPLLAKGPVDDRRFPRENIAEIVVIDLRDHLATGVVLRSTQEARIGDRVESRRGY